MEVLGGQLTASVLTYLYILDLGVKVEDLLYLCGVDVLSTPDDHVF